MSDRLMDLKNDLVFQKIFGRQKNKEITRYLLSLILKKEIKNINLETNRKLIGNKMDEKNGTLDVRATFNDGEDVDIEIQVRPFENMVERILYYGTEMYSEKVKIGKGYSGIKPSIVITNYKIKELKGIERYHTSWAMFEEETKKMLTDKYNVI